ncbi:rod shape-determining protein MreC [Clostridium sp. UBA4548]|uniref:rod shape-determining protein MreC n=1 Tax=Clostridium sp. UBA4548 TaxID=1946361 RepID=UPI0025BCCF8C|nr:rod shape-determining protein MreC [Clostridium sp. UBA4548]
MKNIKNKLAVIVIILSVCFLFLIGYSVQKENVSLVENGVGATLNPIQGLFYKVGNSVKNSLSFIFSVNDIKKENEELRSRNSELENKVTQNVLLEQENQRLRGMLNFTDLRNEYNYIGCDIVGISGSNFLDGYVINKGKNVGIQKGMVAITGEGLVGQVTSVGDNWAIVQSLCNENIAVAGYELSTQESDGIVKGYKGNEDKFLAQITGLSIKSQVSKGDTILTSGLGGIYPKGIKIGEVLEVEEDKAAVVKNAIIKPSVDFNKLEQLIIVVPKETRDVKY